MEAAAVQLAPEPQPPAVERPEVVTLPAPVPGDLELSFADDGVFERTPVEASADERLATAFEALQDLFFLTTAHEGLDFVMRLLEDLTPAEAASACLYDINTDELRFVALTGPGAEERKGDAVPRLAGLIGSAALAAGDALVIHDVSADPRFDPGVDGRVGVEVRSMALAAVLHGGRLFGLLQLINRRGLREFSATDANILAYVAEKLGEFLHLARLRPE
jgi:GAF domain-containing protein